MGSKLASGCSPPKPEPTRGQAMAFREMLRRLLWRLDLPELRTQGAELLITERKVGGGEGEHSAWIGHHHDCWGHLQMKQFG